VWPSTANYGGSAFDALARMHLWQAGLDYGHGTGHGVGSYLNVHEGPQGINSRSTTKLVEGMCVSDEPGYYKDGEFGIRIENVIMVQKHPNPEMAEKFYYFENLTYAPYNRDLIDTNLLSPDVRNFIDSFHKSCFEKLAPYLQDDKRALDYVTRQCAPL
jgi:Xaa-Pro aminopeptidase